MKNKKGIALILALFSLVFVSLVVVMFIDTVTIDQQIATNHIKDILVSFLSDAGVQDAVYRLKADNSYNTDSDSDGSVYPDDPSDYDSDTLSLGGYKVGIPSGALPKTVTSTGTAGDFSRSLGAVIGQSGSSVRISSWEEL